MRGSQTLVPRLRVSSQKLMKIEIRIRISFNILKCDPHTLFSLNWGPRRIVVLLSIQVWDPWVYARRLLWSLISFDGNYHMITKTGKYYMVYMPHFKDDHNKRYKDISMTMAAKLFGKSSYWVVHKWCHNFR